MTIAPTTRPRRDVRPDDRADVLSAKVCRYCGDQLGPFEVDHVRPLSRGGTNDRENLSCACVSCNTQKGRMLLHEWIQWRKANGMFWPPVASHATDPQHYADHCGPCRDALDPLDRPGVRDPSLYIFKADRLAFDGAGYKCYYRCPAGHRWTCWYGGLGDYYSDCMCTFCITCRMEAEA